jgi:hypothetical protein
MPSTLGKALAWPAFAVFGPDNAPVDLFAVFAFAPLRACTPFWASSVFFPESQPTLAIIAAASEANSICFFMLNGSIKGKWRDEPNHPNQRF